MSKLWEPPDRETLDHWISAIETEASEDLSQWESSFMESIHRQFDAGRTLSRAQVDSLEKIYAARTK